MEPNPSTAWHQSATGNPALQTGVQDATEDELKRVVLRVEGKHRGRKGHLTRVDKSSGNLGRAYQEMGSPPYPTIQQIGELRRKSELSPPESVALGSRGEIAITLPPNGVALLELADRSWFKTANG